VRNKFRRSAGPLRLWDIIRRDALDFYGERDGARTRDLRRDRPGKAM
jgi:hypothetical protein